MADAAISSTLKVVSSEVGTTHDVKVHGLTFDELQTQRTRELLDTLYTGTSARRRPVVFIITTAGDDPESMLDVETKDAADPRARFRLVLRHEMELTPLCFVAREALRESVRGPRAPRRMGPRGVTGGDNRVRRPESLATTS